MSLLKVGNECSSACSPTSLSIYSSLNNVSHHHHHSYFVDVYSIYFLFANHITHCCLYLTTYCNGLDIQLPFICFLSQSFCDILFTSFYLVEFYKWIYILMYFVFHFHSLFLYAFIAYLFLVLRMVFKPIFILLDNSIPQLLYFAHSGSIFVLFSLFLHLGWICFFLDFHFIPYFVANILK